MRAVNVNGGVGGIQRIFLQKIEDFFMFTFRIFQDFRIFFTRKLYFVNRLIIQKLV